VVTFRNLRTIIAGDRRASSAPRGYRSEVWHLYEIAALPTACWKDTPCYHRAIRQAG